MYQIDTWLLLFYRGNILEIDIKNIKIYIDK